MNNYSENLMVNYKVLADMLMETCLSGTGQSRMLGRAILESEAMGLDQLQDKVYEYGSRIRERDYEDRHIFVCLVSMLRRMEQQFVYAS